jgi:hypothetical protein
MAITYFVIFVSIAQYFAQNKQKWTYTSQRKYKWETDKLERVSLSQYSTGQTSDLSIFFWNRLV